MQNMRFSMQSMRESNNNNDSYFLFVQEKWT